MTKEEKDRQTRRQIDRQRDKETETKRNKFIRLYNPSPAIFLKRGDNGEESCSSEQTTRLSRRDTTVGRIKLECLHWNAENVSQGKKNTCTRRLSCVPGVLFA